MSHGHHIYLVFKVLYMVVSFKHAHASELHFLLQFMDPSLLSLLHPSLDTPTPTPCHPSPIHTNTPLTHSPGQRAL